MKKMILCKVILTRYYVQFTVKVQLPQDHKFETLMPIIKEEDHVGFLLSPMPGRVVSISVQEGQEVSKGQTLLILEAMKMQNIIRADRTGRIEKVLVCENDTVAVEQNLIKFV